MRRLREERERIARRYTIAGGVFIALLAAFLIAWPIMKGCGRDLFGWDDDYRPCTLSETWNWILSGADWVFWATITTAAVFAIAKSEPNDQS